jgi:hypothetical protein
LLNAQESLAREITVFKAPKLPLKLSENLRKRYREPQARFREKNTSVKAVLLVELPLIFERHWCCMSHAAIIVLKSAEMKEIRSIIRSFGHNIVRMAGWNWGIV